MVAQTNGAITLSFRKFWYYNFYNYNSRSALLITLWSHCLMFSWEISSHFLNLKVWSSSISIENIQLHFFIILSSFSDFEEMCKATTCQLKAELKHGERKPKFFWRMPSRNMTVSSLIILIPLYLGCPEYCSHVQFFFISYKVSFFSLF